MDERRDPILSLPGGEEPPARILLIRHGAAGGSEEGRLIGRLDTDLLPRGEAQVRASAARAAAWIEGPGEVLLFTSPRLRARRSAEVWREALPPGSAASAPETVEGLAEIDLGEWEGETYESLRARAPERLRAHYADFVRSRPPGGESVEDLALRVRPAFAQVRARAAGRTAAVVAHAAVNRVILCDALGAPFSSFFRIEQRFAALNVLDYRGERPSVLLLNG